MEPSLPKSITRRRLIRAAGAGAGIAAAGTAAFGALVEPFHPVTERVTIPLRNLPPAFDGFRIAQITDLHVQPGFPAEALTPALSAIRHEKPDLIVLTGDYINDRAPDRAWHLRQCIQALARLSAPCGIYAIFGNHDFPEPPAEPDPAPWLTVGITPLSDESVEIARGTDSIWLIGLRSAIARSIYPMQVMHQPPLPAIKIVLWHEPDRAPETAALGGSLQLSGHTHGGQIVLPGIGPPILPIAGRNYPAGLFEVGGQMPLYVSRGVGLLPPLVRLNCPPEVTLITLRNRRR